MDRGRVLDRASEYRADSYDDRLGDVLRHSDDLLAEVMRRIPEEGVAGKTVIDIIRKAARPKDAGTGWSLPRGMDAEDYFELMVHRGALQIGRSRRSRLYSCPISSFRDFLIGLGEQGGNAASVS